MTMPAGLLLGATASNSGKTLVCMGLMRALSRRGHQVQPFKSGPDYIDPGYLTAAAGRQCYNIDAWAMPPPRLGEIISRAGRGADVMILEGVMGLFDGAADGTASNADLARELDLPVILLVDAQGAGASVAAVIRGFESHDPALSLAGVIINKVASPRHEQILKQACEKLATPILGLLPRRPDLAMPSRHLGLVQASERDDLETLIEAAADLVDQHLDMDRLLGLMRPATIVPGDNSENTAMRPAIPPLGQRIAVAKDAAFSFIYPHVLEGWRSAGASITLFSPLADEAPPDDADAVYLPGGYPELFAGQLAGNRNFMDGLRRTANSATVLGECGGYMVLGEGLIDKQGAAHAMAGLLPLSSSFVDARLHLGYRRARLVSDGPLGRAGETYMAHEFHYTRIIREAPGTALFTCQDTLGQDQGTAGLRLGRVAGSFLHLIDHPPPK